MFTCCSCGGNKCGCAYCWDCNACEDCKRAGEYVITVTIDGAPAGAIVADENGNGIDRREDAERIAEMMRSFAESRRKLEPGYSPPIYAVSRY